METLAKQDKGKPVESSNPSFDEIESKVGIRPIPYLPHTNEDRNEMLNFIGVSSIEDLLGHVPKELRSFDLKIPHGKSEIELIEIFRKFSNQNVSLTNQSSFCGGGTYNRYIPAVVSEVLSKGEFYTAYTPYQPEVSQGTLQAIYEFQTVVCNLTGMDSCNASLYDGLTAVIEAAIMCKRITNRNKIILSRSINPEAQAICKTYCFGADIQLEFVDFADGITDLNKLKETIDDKTACFIIASPNYAGCIEPIDKIAEIVHKHGAKLVSMVDLISLAVLQSPKNLGVDIIVGDGQATGNSLSYGGPHMGFVCCLKEHVRQLPGRLVGLTKDVKGKRAFTLTLQTREQHIRREKATSNICTNQSLNALAVLVYLTYMGPYGLKKIAEISLNRAHYLLDKLEKVNVKPKDSGKKCKRAFETPFFNEFVLELPMKASELIAKMNVKNILPGLDLNGINGYKSNHILVTVTEMNTIEQIDSYVDNISNVINGG